MKKTAQSLIEYGLILALVAIVALAVLSKFGGTIGNMGNNTSNTVENVSGNAGETYCQSAGLGAFDPETGKCTKK